MPDYPKMYATLFQYVKKAIELLQQAQIKTGEIYLSSGESILTLIPDHQTEDDTTSWQVSSSVYFLIGS